MKKCVNAKEELWKNSKIFHHEKNIIFTKSSNRRNKNPSIYYYNSIITNPKFQYNPKKKSSFKNPHIKTNLFGHLVWAKIP